METYHETAKMLKVTYTNMDFYYIKCDSLPQSDIYEKYPCPGNRFQLFS